MRAQRGYSLIEVIVAFALLALALTLLLGTLTGSTRQLRQADDATRAVLHAQSLMAAQGIEAPLRPGRTQGSFEGDRYRWTLDIKPYVDPRPTPAKGGVEAVSQLQLLQLELAVRWGETPAGQLHWRTLRVAPVSSEGTSR